MNKRCRHNRFNDRILRGSSTPAFLTFCFTGTGNLWDDSLKWALVRFDDHSQAAGQLPKFDIDLCDNWGSKNHPVLRLLKARPLRLDRKKHRTENSPPIYCVSSTAYLKQLAG